MSAWPGDADGMPRTPDAPGAAEGQLIFADYFDGRRALRQRVSLRAEDDVRGRVLALDLPSGDRVRWLPRRIRIVPDQAGSEATTYALSGLSDDRLIVTSAEGRRLIREVVGGHPSTLGGPPLWRRAVAVVTVGAVCIALLLFAVLPLVAGGLARIMDPEAEVAMGEMHYEQTRILFSPGLVPLRECRDAPGVAALQRLTDRVSGDLDLPFPIQVAVLDDSAQPILNAYAVAGGRITFFNSMILAADRPEEIAAVLAHELGHVVHADPVRHTLQATSGMAVLSILLGDVTGGGVLGSTAGAALQSSYSREAELAADAFAHEQLTKVGLPPSALGRMFERLQDEYGDVEGLVAHFSSHPQLVDRIARAAEVGDPTIGAPALTPKDWQALRAICR